MGNEFTDKLNNALATAMCDVSSNPGKYHVRFTANKKTNILSIGLLPLLTCHARCRTTCGQIKPGRTLPDCYAAKFVNRFADSMRRLAINTALYLICPDQYWSEVDQMLRGERFVRLFDSGDTNLPGYFEGLCEVLIRNPHCEVQGFTKCYEVVNAYIDAHGKLPDNLHLLFSGWYEMLPDNPHRLPESRVYDKDLPEGWLSCGGDCRNCACVGLGCWKAVTGDIIGLKKH